MATTGEKYHRIINRFEIKYRLHCERSRKFLERIAPYIRSDPHNSADGFYRVVSLYYDSPDFVCFVEKLDGIKFRRKMRIRLYNECDDEAFLEIKQRIDRTIQKRRVKDNLNDIMKYLDPKNGDERIMIPDRVYGEALFLVHTMQMEPKIMVSYNREAYFSIYEPGLRITVDKNLRYRKYRGEFTFHSGGERFFFPPYEVILEVKFNDVIPDWLCSCLNSFNLVQSRISKYCEAINKAAFKFSL